MMGFPRRIIASLRCTRDGGPLRIDETGRPMTADTWCIVDGTLNCTRCDSRYQIDAGIAHMVGDASLDPESSHEQKIRDRRASSITAGEQTWWDDDDNRMEMHPTLRALAVWPGARLLELGCGDGRYTVGLSASCESILAVDFSIAALRLLQQRLAGVDNVGLVLADVTTITLASSCVDIVFSTLVSNLPTANHRTSLYRLAGDSLADTGRFVFSVHHHGLRQRLSGEQRSGHYQEGHVYRKNFTVPECIDEVRPFFRLVSARPIQVFIPFTHALRLPAVALSRLCERIWPVNYLGMLVLCTAANPLRRK